MSYQDTVQSSICRIVGLQSEEGRKRNGCAARVRLDGGRFNEGSEETRYPVCCDGFPGPLLVKASNIELFPNEPGSFNSNFSQSEVHYISTGVGRGTFLDVKFQTVLVENGTKIDQAILEGGSARSRGTLDAVEMFTRHHGIEKMKKSGSHKSLKLTLTDLNLSRAFNRVANGEEVKLGASLQQKFKKISERFPKNSEQINVLVKFDSHRVHADRFSTKSMKQGPQRLNAVKQGTYQIYPCALKQYLDALEVKYVDISNKKKEYIVLQDIYLDYGKSEATDYIQHATAMNECYRLFPDVLAEVDPQMFWSFMLWFEPIIQVLEQMRNIVPNELIDAWKELKAGKEKSSKYFAMGTIILDAKGPEDNFGIRSNSNDVHLRVATDFAINAMQVIEIAASPRIPKESSMAIHTLDYYKGTELDQFIAGQTAFSVLLKQEKEVSPNGVLSDSTIAKLYNKAMKEAGLKRDDRTRIQDPEKICSSCGKKRKQKLLMCARW